MESRVFFYYKIPEYRYKENTFYLFRIFEILLNRDVLPKSFFKKLVIKYL